MKRLDGFRRGYYIRIIDNFYEVADGNKVVYFGRCSDDSTIDEIAKKTILLKREDKNDGQRIRSNVGTSRAKRFRARNKDYAAKNDSRL